MRWNLDTIKMEVLLAFVFQYSICLEGHSSLGNVGLEVIIFDNGHRRVFSGRHCCHQKGKWINIQDRGVSQGMQSIEDWQ